MDIFHVSKTLLNVAKNIYDYQLSIYKTVYVKVNQIIKNTSRLFMQYVILRGGIGIDITTQKI